MSYEHVSPDQLEETLRAVFEGRTAVAEVEPEPLRRMVEMATLLRDMGRETIVRPGALQASREAFLNKLNLK